MIEHNRQEALKKLAAKQNAQKEEGVEIKKPQAPANMKAEVISDDEEEEQESSEEENSDYDEDDQEEVPSANRSTQNQSTWLAEGSTTSARTSSPSTRYRIGTPGSRWPSLGS